MDTERMNAHGVTAQDLRGALQLANASQPAGSLVAGNREVLVQTGTYPRESAEDVRTLVVGVQDRKPVFLRDVAEVVRWPRPALPIRLVRHRRRRRRARHRATGSSPRSRWRCRRSPAPTPIDVAQAAMQRLENLRGSVIPEGVEVTVTRDYGKTANDKAKKLIQKLAVRHLSVVALVFFALGRREAMIVGARSPSRWPRRCSPPGPGASRSTACRCSR
jgi:multidrug efflux pump subunit AcrB